MSVLSMFPRRRKILLILVIIFIRSIVQGKEKNINNGHVDFCRGTVYTRALDQ